MVLHSGSEQETTVFGKKLGESLLPGDVVALNGGLGAGKTAFTRGIAQALGVAEHITSPTYTIVNEYYGTMPLFHFDAYRLDNGDSLFELGWDEYLERGGVTVVEWSEIIKDCLPEHTITVNITSAGETEREIIIKGRSLWE